VPHDSFIYSEFGHGSHWSYHPPHMRRPQSTEPDHYETKHYDHKPRVMSNEVWTAGM
jgi:hypothetical protein